ncbi:hypothetical protein [Hydrogenovibrio kuenenii]|uniref:hypothetical protein n=1 Tax=Hydrogenovibrio kuenenii TaxID=63658 RepID=UPI0012FEB777|nr:hypothetical protein [Hydrogenovibrio kuenenii]
MSVFTKTLHLIKNEKLGIISTFTLPIAFITVLNMIIEKKINLAMHKTPSLVGIHLIEQLLSQNIIYILIVLILYISFTINICRFTILGNESVPSFGISTPRKREFLFFLYSLVLFFIFTLVIITCLLIPIIGIFIGFFIIVVLSARLYFIFPAIAIDDKASRREAWKISKGYTLSIAIIMLLFPYLVTLPFEILINSVPLFSSFFKSTPAGEITSSVVNLLFYAFNCMLMAMSFKIIKEQHQEEVLEA